MYGSQPTTVRAKNTKRCRDVNVEHRLPLFVAVVVQRAVPDVARVVYDDVESTALFHRRGDQPVGQRRIGEVASERDAADLLCGRVEFIGIDVVHEHERAFACEFTSGSAPNAAGSASNERGSS